MVRFMARSGRDFEDVGTVRLVDGKLQVRGNTEADSAMLERLIRRPIAAPGGKRMLCGIEDPEEWLKAAPRIYNGSAFCASLVEENEGK